MASEVSPFQPAEKFSVRVTTPIKIPTTNSNGVSDHSKRVKIVIKFSAKKKTADQEDRTLPQTDEGIVAPIIDQEGSKNDDLGERKSSESEVLSSENMPLIETNNRRQPTTTTHQTDDENLPVSNETWSSRNKAVEKNKGKMKKKPFCSFKLSREEIEEDVLAINAALRGSTNKRLMMRRPKKRSMELRRQLDRLCPGHGCL